MTTYISILRGINVSGHNKIKMPELVEMYKEIGFSGIQTYIQSGNVIFKADENDPASAISNRIEKAILKKFGYQVTVIIRTKKEMKEIIDANPILKNSAPAPEKLYVTFLDEIPLSAEIDKIDHFNYLPDKFLIIGKEVYLDCAGGYGTTKLSNTFFENKLRVKATTRNWNTVNKLFELAGED